MEIAASLIIYLGARSLKEPPEIYCSIAAANMSSSSCTLLTRIADEDGDPLAGPPGAAASEGQRHWSVF